MAAVRRSLLRWYDRNRRDLPWRRRASDPYAQWVAEIMLQQTRVETVIPYYERFLARFPTAEKLAAAPDETVLKHWEGLGYYRRVLHLHRAAQELAATDRPVPRSAAELRELPGIGSYTAAAISSIAAGEPVAAVDGNVARVIARLIGLQQDVLSNRGRAVVQEIADALLARRRPGDFNQAWMDLGSSVCTARNPQCEHCPLTTHCQARAAGIADQLPIRGASRPRAVPVVRRLVLAYLKNDRLLMHRRPKGGLWSGLWELPGRDLTGDQPLERELRILLRLCGTRATEAEFIGATEHRLTHRLYRFELFGVRSSSKGEEAQKTTGGMAHACVARQGVGRAPHVAESVARRARPTDLRWASPLELNSLSVSTAQRRVLALAWEWIESGTQFTTPKMRETGG